MINAGKLSKLSKKWQNIIAKRRKGITFSRANSNWSSDCSIAAASASTGHFVIYTVDGRRFVVPLECLNNIIFIQLFKIAEEMYGLPVEGPIKLPCNASFMEYIVSLVKKGLARDIQKALLTSLEDNCCSSSIASNHQEMLDHPVLVY